MKNGKWKMENILKIPLRSLRPLRFNFRAGNAACAVCAEISYSPGGQRKNTAQRVAGGRCREKKCAACYRSIIGKIRRGNGR